jgi:thiol-disulfide isomerase/thioredoxin
MELFSLSLLTGTLAFGQMANAPNRVPSVSANHLINYDKGILKLTDFKGKFVILEFWSPTCISCLEGFPRLDSLQRAFDGRIQIILVNQANKEETVRFFQTHPRVTRPSLPFITGDRVLNANFPHQGNPATAVLDTSGKMICMPANINSNNIKLLLEGRPNFKLMQKQIYVTSLFDERWQDLPEY